MTQPALNILNPGPVILAGIVGSHAYGLAHDQSDIDRLGVYVSPTDTILGLHGLPETVTGTHPSDHTYHEAGKYLRLALACNPTITELLWLPEHETVTDEGETLLALRTGLLSASRVRDAYLGYARSQLARLQKRQDGTFSSDTRNRSGKHARHMARLLTQGLELYTTGHLTLRLANPDWYLDFSNAGPAPWETWFTEQANRFSNATTCLPDKPDIAAAEQWLLSVRYAHLPALKARR